MEVMAQLKSAVNVLSLDIDIIIHAQRGEGGKKKKEKENILDHLNREPLT